MNRILLLLALGAILARPAAADPIADFYKGRTVTLVIGYSVGGGYDLYARLVARYLGKHIPGNPEIVPQNMPGAGSLKAVKYLDSVAPADGSVIGTFGRSMGLEPLLDPKAGYDGTKFAWLGSATNDVSLCVTWKTSPIATFQDALAKEVKLGGEGAGADPDVFALTLKNVFGAKVKLVTGFPGTNETTLAMERGEIDGLCGLSLSTLEGRHGAWLNDGSVHILDQAGIRKSPKLPNVPLLSDLTQDSEKKSILKFIVAPQGMARPFVAPPRTPPARKAALRAAFDAAMKDPAFLAEAEKTHIDINPVGGSEIDTMLAELYATPKPLIAKAAAAMSR
ncbi:MAG: Bug family tripartite tricarboxylate transporter substrate binding protein [Stellaceae bacterium]